MRVIAAGGEEFGVVGDALSDVVVHAELGVDRHPLAVFELLGRQGDAARRPAALDAEQVVVVRGQLAGSPRGLIYATRKTVVEPVFGQIKQARGFRQFLLRGLKKVQGEWAIICLTHNILKLHRLCYG